METIITISGSCIFYVERCMIKDLSGTTRCLTPLEFGVMKFLTENENSVLTKDHIIEKVWGYDALDQGLANVIAKLRRDFPALKRAIKTVRGIGYALILKSF